MDFSNTTRHRYSFPTHGTFHCWKEKTANGGWVRRDHEVSSCDRDCAQATNIPWRIIQDFPHGHQEANYSSNRIFIRLNQEWTTKVGLPETARIHKIWKSEDLNPPKIEMRYQHGGFEGTFFSISPDELLGKWILMRQELF